jgi:hypothetical protein
MGGVFHQIEMPVQVAVAHGGAAQGKGQPGGDEQRRFLQAAHHRRQPAGAAMLSISRALARPPHVASLMLMPSSALAPAMSSAEAGPVTLCDARMGMSL